MKKLFLFAGEPSGDLHGSRLLRSLKKVFPDDEIEGVAGPAMRTEGMKVFLPMEDFAVMGITDVVLAFPRLWNCFYLIRDHILSTQPAAVVLIDYPGFNLRMAKALRKKGYQGKIIQYICPTVWAHGKKRIQTMTDTLDLLITTYPFEADYFADSKLNVKYVGHPLKERLEEYPYQPSDKEKELIAVFPGSREGEIVRNFPKIVEAIELIKQKSNGMKFAISCASDKMKQLIVEQLGKTTLKADHDFIFVPESESYNLMRNSRTAIAKSGTVTLELALHERPTVVVYELSKLNRFVAKHIMGLKLPFYCIVNILGKKEIFPELIEYGFTSENLAKHLLELNNEGVKRQQCMDECEKINAMLGEHKASGAAAEAIRGLLLS